MATQLLNEDGSASMATLAMMSHHGLLRDIALFGAALARLADGDAEQAQALGEEWQSYRATLHGHHTVEDERIFPSLRAAHPDLSAVFDRLDAEHRLVDPMLARGDLAFGDLLRHKQAAATLIAELRALLEAHLAFEEANIVRYLRSAKEFPTPGSEAELELYANGFAWSLHGIAPSVIEQVHKLLPAPLTARLPAARKAYDARCQRVWGSASTRLSTTSVPQGL